MKQIAQDLANTNRPQAIQKRQTKGTNPENNKTKIQLINDIGGCNNVKTPPQVLNDLLSLAHKFNSHKIIIVNNTRAGGLANFFFDNDIKIQISIKRPGFLYPAKVDLKKQLQQAIKTISNNSRTEEHVEHSKDGKFKSGSITFENVTLEGVER